MKRIDKRTYPAIFHYSREKEYCLAVSFPDFPGCVIKGRTTEEAIEMAQETLALHLHGMEGPVNQPHQIVHCRQCGGIDATGIRRNRYIGVGRSAVHGLPLLQLEEIDRHVNLHLL